MKFNPRLTKPEKGNKYYNTKYNGGYSNAIQGKVKSTGKPDPDCNVLANCVGYAFGRFHEIIGDTKMSYLSPVNAENFPEYIKKGLKTGQTPKLGAIICWQKGATLKGSDGAGHVAVVEQIFSDGSILTSESGYNANSFWTQKRSKGSDENWGQSSAYKFRCFIYSPVEFEEAIEKTTVSKNSKGSLVIELQQALNKVGNYNLESDGLFGLTTEKAVKDFQKKNKLTVDGIVDKATWNSLDEALAKLKKPECVVDLEFMLDNAKTTAWGTNIKGENYIRLRDLETLGIVKSAVYNSSKKQIEVKTK